MTPRNSCSHRSRRPPNSALLLLASLACACSGSSEDELLGADSGSNGRIDGGGAGDDSGSPSGLDAGDGDGGTGPDGGPGEAGVLTGHPKSCEPAVLAGDTTGLHEDFPRIITGPGSKALITWGVPVGVQSNWYARTYDSQTFGPVHRLFDGTGTGNIGKDLRAVVGYGHGLFHAVGADFITNYLRRFDQASDTWSDSETQVAATMELAVRPNGSFLRVVGTSTGVATLDTIDPTTGVVQSTQTLGNFGVFLSSMNPTAIAVDADDRGGLLISPDNVQGLHAYVLRAGQVVADATLANTEYINNLTAIQQSSGDTVFIWQGDAGIRISRLSYNEGTDTASLSAPEYIYEGAGGGMLAVGTPDGELTVVWGNGKTYARRYVGGAWGDIVTVDERVGGGPSTIAISDAGMVAFMLDPYAQEGGTLSTVLKGQHSWSRLEGIPGREPYRSSMAFNAAGEPYFIWAAAARDLSSRREIMLITCR